MAVHLNRLPEFEYPKNALLDFSPINQALDAKEKQYQFDASKALEAEKIGLQRQTVDIHQRQFDAQERQRQVEEWGRLASVADEEKNPQRRQQLWGQLVNSHEGFAPALQKYGINPNDHINGPKFIRAQAGLYDPNKERTAQADINLKNAHAGYYGAAGQALRERSSADRQRADVMKFRAVTDYFQNQSPTREQWNAANAPGGVIPATFGFQIPYEKAPLALAQAKRRSQMPEDQDLEGMGFSPEQIKDMKRAKAFEASLGKPKVGYVWSTDDKGQPYQKKVGETDDKSSLPAAQLEFNMENLRNSFAVISGTVNKNGKLSGGSNILQRGISAIPGVGPALAPATDEAYMNAEHAALQLSYALSGKQIGQQEQARILSFFAPNRVDTNERAAFKMNAAMGLYQRLLEAKRKGVTDDARAEMFDSELNRQARKLRQFDEYQRRNGLPPQQKFDSIAPPKTNLGKMSDEELLRELNK